MGATGGVNVMIPGVPVSISGVDPPGELKGFVVRVRGSRDLDVAAKRQVLGTSADLDEVPPGRQRDALAIGTIDLLVKEEVWR